MVTETTHLHAPLGMSHEITTLAFNLLDEEVAMGMRVVSLKVDVKTGRRRVITYLLDPLLRGLDECLREPR